MTALTPSYHVEASITINLLANENDGAVLIDIQPGHLCRENVIALALQALANEIVEWTQPTPYREREKVAA